MAFRGGVSAVGHRADVPNHGGFLALLHALRGELPTKC